MPKLKAGMKALGGAPVAFCAVILLAMAVAGCGNSGNSPAPRPQGLWVSNYGANSVAEFAGATLKTSGSPAPDLINYRGLLTDPFDIAFDKNGNMWVSSWGSGGISVIEFTTSQLKNLKIDPTPNPDVFLYLRARPWGLTFDKSGNLWVALPTANKIEEFIPSQLTAIAAPTPTITIDSPSFNEPSALEFDESGNLWVANVTGNNVLEFTPSQLEAGGSPTPNITLATGTITADWDVAFDHSGNLWVTNYGTSTVQEFAASSLTGTGTIAPAAAVTISATAVTSVPTGFGTTQSLDHPTGLAFDRSGNLWVANYFSDNYGSLAEFTPGQLAATGSPSPSVFLDSDPSATNIGRPMLITFEPEIK